MALLKYLGVSYLSLGYKPSNNIGEITGMPRLMIWATRSLYHHLFQTLFIDGKMKFQICFRPDDNQKSSLCLVFPTKNLGPHKVAAIAQVTHLDIGHTLAKHFTGFKRPLPVEMPTKKVARGWKEILRI